VRLSWQTIAIEVKTVTLKDLPALLLFCAAPLLAQQPIQHAPDGGSSIHIQSIDIPAIPNAPFTATVVTESTRVMPDGSKATNWNHRLVARDSAGRVFQERRYFNPHGDTQETILQQLQYDNPNTHEMILCNPFNKVCQVYVRNYITTLPAQNASRAKLISLKNGTTIQNEELGRNTIEGVDCLGSREITTLAVGVIGNEKPQPIVKEFWYAPNLGVNLLTKRFDPRVSSIQNFTVTQLKQSEPDSKTFAPPEGYTIIRVRTGSSATVGTVAPLD
jgi:hypothetical protein